MWMILSAGLMAAETPRIERLDRGAQTSLGVAGVSLLCQIPAAGAMLSDGDAVLPGITASALCGIGVAGGIWSAGAYGLAEAIEIRKMGMWAPTWAGWTSFGLLGSGLLLTVLVPYEWPIFSIPMGFVSLGLAAVQANQSHQYWNLHRYHWTGPPLPDFAGQTPARNKTIGNVLLGASWVGVGASALGLGLLEYSNAFTVGEITTLVGVPLYLSAELATQVFLYTIAARTARQGNRAPFALLGVSTSIFLASAAGGVLFAASGDELVLVGSGSLGILTVVLEGIALRRLNNSGSVGSHVPLVLAPTWIQDRPGLALSASW